jgi:hypothetical protein
MAPDNVKFSIHLPEWYERKLQIIGKLRGINRAALGATYIREGIDREWDDAEKELSGIAQYRGITTEELIKEWLNGGDDD